MATVSSPPKKVPVVQRSFIVRDPDSSVYAAVAGHLLKSGRWIKKSPASSMFDLMLGDRNKLPYEKLQSGGKKARLVNYYRGNDELCMKARMCKSFDSFCHANKLSFDQWVPKTFAIKPVHICDEEAMQIRDQFVAYVARNGGLWIAKSTNGAKGEGILITHDPAELLHFIDKSKKTHVAQYYVEKPLLLPGRRKFDIRLWVLLDPKYQIFIHKEGVARTASDPYDIHDLNNITSHLTNHCIQQAYSKHFGEFEPGNEIFFDEFARILKKEFDCNFEEVILPQMRNSVELSLIAVQEHMEISFETHGFLSFQLFGFDFMVEENMQVWLLEVNAAPACASKLLPQISADIVKCAINPVFFPADKGGNSDSSPDYGGFQLV